MIEIECLFVFALLPENIGSLLACIKLPVQNHLDSVGSQLSELYCRVSYFNLCLSGNEFVNQVHVLGPNRINRVYRQYDGVSIYNIE